jgi:hypothetical protein
MEQLDLFFYWPLSSCSIGRKYLSVVVFGDTNIYAAFCTSNLILCNIFTLLKLLTILVKIALQKYTAGAGARI